MADDKLLLLGGVIAILYVGSMFVLFTINAMWNWLCISVDNDSELNARRAALGVETGVWLTLDEARAIAIAEDHAYYTKY